MTRNARSKKLKNNALNMFLFIVTFWCLARASEKNSTSGESQLTNPHRLIVSESSESGHSQPSEGLSEEPLGLLVAWALWSSPSSPGSDGDNPAVACTPTLSRTCTTERCPVLRRIYRAATGCGTGCFLTAWGTDKPRWEAQNICFLLI